MLKTFGRSHLGMGIFPQLFRLIEPKFSDLLEKFWRQEKSLKNSQKIRITIFPRTIFYGKRKMGVAVNACVCVCVERDGCLVVVISVRNRWVYLVQEALPYFQGFSWDGGHLV